jgi:hypothetical protein
MFRPRNMAAPCSRSKCVWPGIGCKGSSHTDAREGKRRQTPIRASVHFMKETMEVPSEDKIVSENVVCPPDTTRIYPAPDGLFFFMTYFLSPWGGGAWREPPFPLIPFPSCDNMWSEKGLFMSTFRIYIFLFLWT